MTIQSHGHIRKHVRVEQKPNRDLPQTHLRGSNRTPLRPRPVDRPTTDPNTDEPVAFFAKWCGHIMTRIVGGGARLTDVDLAPVRDAAFRWVRGGVTLDEALKACHTGARRRSEERRVGKECLR